MNNKEKKKKGSVVKLSTDPQSVAARERRHRISDRFKILQSLIPGGSKMDTVTMLEEATHYVKFLKTQIWLHQTMINIVDDYGNPNYHDQLLMAHDYNFADYYPNDNNPTPVENAQINYNLDQLQLPGYAFSDGNQFPGEETNISGDAFMYY